MDPGSGSMNREQLFFISGALKLEGRLAAPLRTGAGAGVVICHPHPLYGGSMENNVVRALSRALAEKGIAVLCFNFRGVGRSEGAHDGGRGEIDDALAAIDFMAERNAIDPGRLGLAGYSFGGAVALSAAVRSGRIRAVAAVSPPEIPDLSNCDKPRLVLCGSVDALIPASSILRHEEMIIGPDAAGAVEVIEGADHFWHGHEAEAGGRTALFFLQHLCSPFSSPPV